MLFKYIPESNYTIENNSYWCYCPECNNSFLLTQDYKYIDIMSKYDPQLWECDRCNTLFYAYQRPISYGKHYHPNVVLFNPYVEE